MQRAPVVRGVDASNSDVLTFSCFVLRFDRATVERSPGAHALFARVGAGAGKVVVAGLPFFLWLASASAGVSSHTPREQVVVRCEQSLRVPTHVPETQWSLWVQKALSRCHGDSSGTRRFRDGQDLSRPSQRRVAPKLDSHGEEVPPWTRLKAAPRCGCFRVGNLEAVL
jgi:hypothetical protein